MAKLCYRTLLMYAGQTAAELCPRVRHYQLWRQFHQHRPAVKVGSLQLCFTQMGTSDADTDVLRMELT